MGIPKFFRYISERYPLISQLIEANKIPEFDNLYLDFNGIIHNCSHPNDGDAHYRISEQEIFTAIFAYVDHLFSKIKPQKLFFMAIDGVAPRAKMNQQRSRRFRTAKEAKEVREKAISKGEKLPEEKAFDSNCITPGTTFMARLSEQLRYFVNKKISEDANWRGIEVILSGHDVPGEGEHKIMEYIRHAKAQPGYNPNVRHCLYGLDADLIMLGLLSHDPHFCLLREEVKFGPAARKRNTGTLESQSFFLLHLSLLREYLDLEFHSIATTLPFTYNLERVIDDFITLAVFVGNDFLPNLPDLHIHENALERLFEIYKIVLPGLGGYLNNSGVIDMSRLQKIMAEMSGVEKESFEKENSDTHWFKGKQRKFANEKPDKNKKTMGLTSKQKSIFKRVEEWVLSNQDAPLETKRTARLEFVNDLAAGDRRFISGLAVELHLEIAWDEYDDQDQNLIVLRLPASAVEEVSESEDNGEEWKDEDDEESKIAIARVLNKYNQANVLDDDGFDERYENALQQKMAEWKDRYYKEKLEFSSGETTSQEVRDLVFKYCEGLQWVMYYYYSGVASWGWFYNYHYAPRISDLQNVAEFAFHFDLGKPFRPFEQLMGVLPAASQELVPQPYRRLMTDPKSPVADFYPLEFTQDMNGKKQEWEAIVKIPFIEETRLLSAMAECESLLTEDERRRNSFGPSMKFIYTEEKQPVYPSSYPGIFPDITNCFCIMEAYDLPTLDGLHLVQGLCDGVQLGADALAGFPSLKTLRQTGMLAYHNVNVFNSDSRNKSMIIHIENQYENKPAEQLAQQMLGRRAFLGWPFLHEGQVVAISDAQFKYTKAPGGAVVANRMGYEASNVWKRKVERLTHLYSKRFGVIVGDVDVLVQARPLKGLKRAASGALVKDYQDTEIEQAMQLVITQVASEDPRFVEKEPPPLSEEFPIGTRVFFLGEHAYGTAAQVSETTDKTLSIMIAFIRAEAKEPDSFKQILATRVAGRYFPSYIVAEKLNMSPLALSRITSSFMVLGPDGSKVNLGLGLKFEAKGLKVMEYTRKEGRNWEFSDKAMQLIRDYKTMFPELFKSLEGRNTDDMSRAADIFRGADPDMRLREAKSWLSKRGVRDFEPVALSCDQLDKETVRLIENLADELTKAKHADTFKKALVKGIPREAVLLPAHAQYRLQGQSFSLGDRVTMVQETGGVPLSAKGVVVALNANSMDVVWDIPFMSGTTLQNRCSQYRGSTVMFSSCLNLTRRQYVMETGQKSQQVASRQATYMPRGRGGLAVQPTRSDSQPRLPQPPFTAPMKIMNNPNRPGPQQQSQPSPIAATASSSASWRGGHTPSNSVHATVFSDPAIVQVSRGGAPLPRDIPQRGGSPAPRGGYRGRGHYHNTSQSGRSQDPAYVPDFPQPPNGTQGFRGRGRGDFVPRVFRGAGEGRGGGRGFRGRGRGRGATPADVSS